MKNILVLCTGNSCRSVMAEALINHLGKGLLSAVSAGSFPAGYIHPKSLETLQRHGVEVNDPRSKSWDEFVNQPFDYVVTVCDQAANETCPAFSGEYKKLHWSTPDPAKAEGDDDTVNRAFEEAFQKLKDQIEKEFL